MERFVDTRINNCYFGYGGIVVHAYAQVVAFKEIKPTVEVGVEIYDKEYNKIGDWEFTGNQLSIIFDNMDEINKFCMAIDKTEELKGGFFKFKDVILDFTHYEQKSMDVVKGAIKVVRRNMISLTAC